MFGLVSKAQLARHAEELRRDVERSRLDMEALKYEWASWYDKFRSLYARLLKRDKADKAEPGGDGVVTGTEESTPSARIVFPRSRRGF